MTSSPELRIRPVGIAEAPALAILIAGFRDHLRARVPSDAEIERELPRALAAPALEVACAWLGGQPVGSGREVVWVKELAPR